MADTSTSIAPQLAERMLEDLRSRLLETGTRNRLIHVNRGARRANALNIINERADDVFDILWTNRRKMRFTPTGSDDLENSEDVVLAPPDDPESERYTDRYLETPLGPNALQKRLLRLAREARVAEEEQGVNILYLAIGFLTWFEDESSSVPREAPLILLPVDLVRNERTGRYDIHARDDELVANMPLQQRLNQDFGIRLPEIDEAENEGESLIPSGYFDAVAESIAAHPRWTIDRDGIQLGFFSFSKLLMLLDLYPDKWLAAFGQDSLVQQLLTSGFEPDPPLFSEGEPLDPRIDPSDLLHVIDADASQTKAIEEVRAGRSIVVQGPPGTGKSQTITNMIAAAANDGKRVLFMAEKMAALDVVHRNLVNVGLHDLCLELHSRKANKRAVLEELSRTLNSGDFIPRHPAPPDELRHTRDQLNRIDQVLHTPLPNCDYTPFDALAEVARFYGQGVEPPQLQTSGLESITQAEREKLTGLIADYVAARERAEPIATNPFREVTALDLQPTDLQRLGRELDAAGRALDELMAGAESAATRLALPTPDSLTSIDALRTLFKRLGAAPNYAGAYTETLFGCTDDYRLKEALKAGATYRRMHDEVASWFTDAAWKADTERLRPALSKGVGSFLYRLFGAYRSASRELAGLLSFGIPRKPAERLARVDELLAIQHQRAQLAVDETYLSEAIGPVWREDQTDFAGLLAVLNWLEDIKATGLIEDASCIVRWLDEVEQPDDIAADLGTKTEAANAVIRPLLQRLGLIEFEDTSLAGWSLSDLRDRLAGMQSAPDRYDHWRQFAKTRDRLTEANLGELENLVADGVVAGTRAQEEFHYAVAEARWRSARETCPELDELPQQDRHQLVETFRRLDKKRIHNTQQLIRANHLAQLPQGAVGEMGFLRGEMAKKRGHRSIRKIMEAAGQMVQRIKPVFLMSPISAAQFLPPGQIDFDVLVIDEASQVRPEDAIGAMARAKQVVVVGDKKQLPPTTFFDRLTGNTAEPDEEETEEGELPSTRPGELESVLTLCEARGLRSCMLEWHYRSRDPSLIAVSNAEFYEGRLILPPAPIERSEEYGLSFRKIDGVYSSRHAGAGRPGTNWTEAEAIVSAVARHARDWPTYSLGVVAFSKTQSDMINMLLDRERTEDLSLDAFLCDGRREETFVKNIENVQGDERDVILISVGYGPQEAGSERLRMQFGPINNEGGERRLNVLFTRSRIRCEVFASFDPANMDVSRSTQKGPRVLKRFLEYAKTGQFAQRLLTGEEPDSPFEQDVAEVIGSLGYTVDPQVGTAGFRIDLGVRSPNRPGEYLLAVECDGATYHSALWARERDRHRQEILEDFGWRFHRIWSTDWFYRRAGEIERLRRALTDAEDAGQYPESPTGSNALVPATTETEETNETEQAADHTDSPTEGPQPLAADTYRKADFKVDESLEPHEVPTERLAGYVARVVELEGPIHSDEVARRIATIFDKGRTGRRIQDATQRALQRAYRRAHIKGDDSFWFTEAQATKVPIRDRSAEGIPTTKADYLPPMEVRAAADRIKQESGAVEEDELVRSVARLLGFQRVGQDLQAQIRASLHN